mmetsp:Transcript_73651/g.148389  ORF Transcript_73651/g.148389 Transcript_73651/m.148389 type:complete len:218 (-) Transcript_73651:196-849(-)
MSAPFEKSGKNALGHFVLPPCCRNAGHLLDTWHKDPVTKVTGLRLATPSPNPSPPLPSSLPPPTEPFPPPLPLSVAAVTLFEEGEEEEEANSPEASRAFHACVKAVKFGVLRLLIASTKTASELCAAESTSSSSRRFEQAGFSQSTCFWCRSIKTAWRACSLVGLAMYTASTWSLAARASSDVKVRSFVDGAGGVLAASPSSLLRFWCFSANAVARS